MDESLSGPPTVRLAILVVSHLLLDNLWEYLGTTRLILAYKKK